MPNDKDDLKELQRQNEQLRTQLSAAESRVQELELAAIKANDAYAAEAARLAARIKALEEEITRYRDGVIAESLKLVQATLEIVKKAE